MRHTTLTTLLALGTLALTGCPEEGKELMREASEARREAIDEVGGAPKRQVDQAKARIDAAAKAQADKLNQIPTE